MGGLILDCICRTFNLAECQRKEETVTAFLTDISFIENSH